MNSQKGEKKNHKYSNNTFQSVILSIWDNRVNATYSIKQITYLLKTKGYPICPIFHTTIKTLTEKGIIIQLKNNTYKKNQHFMKNIGIVNHINSRYAYVVIEGKRDDIYVTSKNLVSAIHNDTVEIVLLPKKNKTHQEGKVIRVIKRNRHRFVGRLKTYNNHSLVIPDFKKIHHDFFISPKKINKAKSNDKVICEVVRWGDYKHYSEVKIVKILGKTGENEAEMCSIMSEFNLPFQFDQPIMQEAESIQENISPREIKKRKDLRSILTFTIDPDEAKDFDDAISCRILKNGDYEIGIHIADVSYYILPNTELDHEAYLRATSVYLVDRTVPMLPGRLSNHLCSLRPKEDKLSFSVIFEMDKNAHIKKIWFGKTIINSNYQFTYDEAQKILDGKGDVCAKELKTLNGMALQLRKNRINNGALNFEKTEVKFVLNAQKKPLEIIQKEKKDTHKLVEEFMLLANKEVASHIFKHIKKENKNLFVYRTHDSPDSKKIIDFAQFARQFGYKIDIHKEKFSHSINALMQKIEGQPEQNVLNQLAIRTMEKAKYTTESKNHFGLAFNHYTHFTSPIRRYPDLMVHRMLQSYLTGHAVQNKKEFEEKCIHCSEKEKNATNAERASIKYKQVEFMSTAADKIYNGIITGVSDFGIFIEIIETQCEGMARLKDLKDDFYNLDEKNFQVVGIKKGKIYQLGNTVKSRIKKVDIDRRTIDLVIVE